MSYSTIKEYNTYLVDNKVPINIINYVKEINKIEYKLEDISFIDDFIKLVHRKDFCIHHSMLQKHKILSLKGSTNHVKKLLENNNFEENIDYTVTQVCHRVSLKTIYKNVYHLTPNCFKLCAMRSQNVKTYARYYLLIEIAMSYFSKYQIKLEKKYNIEYIEIITEHKEIINEQKNIITQKDDKINEQNNKLDILQNQLKILLEKSDEQIRKSDKILKVNVDIKKESKRTKKQLNNISQELKISHEKIDNITEELVDTKEELEDTNNNVKLIAEKLDIAVIDRVSRPKTLSTLEYFIVMKSNTNTDYKYYIIRGQKGYANGQKNKLDEYTEIKTIECCPNANILWRLLKEQLINNIEYNRNRLNIIDMNEDTFLEKIDIIYNTRKIVEIN